MTIIEVGKLLELDGRRMFKRSEWPASCALTWNGGFQAIEQGGETGMRIAPEDLCADDWIEVKE